MKLKFPKKKRGGKLPSIIGKSLWLVYVLTPLAITSAFVFGMLFYRSGSASVVAAKIRTIYNEGMEPPEAVKEIVDEVTDEINTEMKLYQSNGLPTLFLDIPFDSMLTLQEKRDEALSVGVLLSSDDDYVPARIHYNSEQTLDSKIRLKGDWVDHLKGNKWSYRIHITEDDGAIRGMRRFSLQAPETRRFVNEWGYHQNLFLEDILTTRYSFVNVVVNGEHKGIYALEESFTEDLLESQNRREGIIFRIDEDLMWSNWARYKENGDVYDETAINVGLFMHVNPDNSDITPFRGSRIEKNEALSQELQLATEILLSFRQGILPSNQALDEKLWGRYYAITDLWAAGHGTAWHNERFYYNPVTGLLEPVAFDGDAFDPSNNKDELAYPFSGEDYFQTPGVQKAYIQTLERITSPKYIEMLQETFGAEIGTYYSLLVNDYKRRELPKDISIQLPWGELETRRDILARNINPSQPVRGNYHFVQVNGTPILRLDLVNLMVIPVEIQEIVIDNASFPFNLDWCTVESCRASIVEDTTETILFPGRKNNFQPVPFQITLDNFTGQDSQAGEIHLRVNLYGGSDSFEVPIFSNYVPQGIESSNKPITTLEKALAAHTFLQELGENQLIVQTGDWNVIGDLVLPEGYDLLIPEGTTLKFEQDSVFLINGRVDIIGTDEEPVRLTAQKNSWGGMVIFNAKEKSTWKYVIAEKMNGISRAGWLLTGGITFYQSPVNISFSVIGDNTSEDAINVIRAPFSLDVVEFHNTSSDAFDGDFTNGSVSNSSFHDVQGDAFDVSGTDATVTDSFFVNIGDKAISAGENSELTLSNLTMHNVSIGVASKDLSNVMISTSSIDNARFAGLTAYIKKPQYGPAFIQADEVEITNSETLALCQTHSTITLNNEQIQTEDIDVDKLYEEDILGN